MATEDTSVAPTSAPQHEASAMTPPALTPPQPQIGYAKMLAEGAKYTVFAVFGLYAIGFLIWHFYLASFGVSSIPFLQSEYLAAAFCYLFLLAFLSLPLAFLGELFGHGNDSKAELPFQLVVSVWNLIAVTVLKLFFPAQLSPRQISISLSAGVVAGLLLFLLKVALGKTNREPRVLKSLAGIDLFNIGWFVSVIFQLLFNPDVGDRWVISALFFYFIVITYAGRGSRRFLWASDRSVPKFLVVSLLAVLLFENIQSFGTAQFGRMPRSVGGGKPETVFLKFSTMHPELPSFLNIAISTNQMTAGFAGPLTILLRTDKEIILFNSDKLPSEWDVTGTHHATNLARAKLVRADLVDAVLFGK